MRLIYSLLYTAAFLLALPYFLIVGLLSGKYIKTAWQRFGFDLPRSGNSSIWVHAVSVGEFLAAKPLIRRIREEMPEVPLFVSTTTKTGQALAKEMLGTSAFYFPFDWKSCIQRVFDQIRPRLIVILETEIWPNFLWEAKNQKIPVMLVNGRISDRSFSRYHKFRRWIPFFDIHLMQSEQDATRMKLLGAEPSSVFVMGNLKFDFHSTVLTSPLRKLIQNWKGEELLWICGSTMKGEDQILIQIYQNLRRRYPLKLMIAPRHPERFDEVIDLIKQNHLSVARRTESNFNDASVVVLDTIGELAACYELADIVFLGGTIGAYGGHNPIEPAFFGKAILAGSHYNNFRAVFEAFLARNAIVITDQIEQDLQELLDDREKRRHIGEAARKLVQENAGATEIVLQKIRENIHARGAVEPDSKLFVR